MDVLPKRFAKYGLTIHPDKTRLVPFERPDHGPKPPDSKRRQSPGTFDLLGFTHFLVQGQRISISLSQYFGEELVAETTPNHLAS